MPGTQSNNFQASESLASAPPPPSEVKIRTMRSDLESMAKTGGGMPQFRNLKVAGLAAGQKTVPEKAGEESHKLMIAVITVLGLLVLAMGAYFAYRFLMK